MIEILDKKDCVGCNACTQICPKQCITMQEDHEGFLYPQIDLSLCIDCHLCEKVCPVIHQEQERKPLAVYAAKNKNEQIRKESSSGGIFTLLAEQIIEEGGVVCGARFDDNWDVIHDFTETTEGLKAFRGSKYVQSRIGGNFAKAKAFLKEGRKVLFSGTPCQIAGLKRFLRKEYEDLLTVDFVCHGVPSPKVWRLYRQSLLDKVEKNLAVATTSFPYFIDIQFRNKQTSWKKYSFQATIRKVDGNTVLWAERADRNVYMKGFLSDLYLRPSCYKCPVKSLKSGSDITIADFWGIQNHYPVFDDDCGTSLVLVSSEKGQTAYEGVRQEQEILQVPSKIAYEGNQSIDKSAKPHTNRSCFFEQVHVANFTMLVSHLTKQPLLLKMKAIPYRLARKVGLITLIKKIR